MILKLLSEVQKKTVESCLGGFPFILDTPSPFNISCEIEFNCDNSQQLLSQECFNILMKLSACLVHIRTEPPANIILCENWNGNIKKISE